MASTRRPSPSGSRGSQFLIFGSVAARCCAAAHFPLFTASITRSRKSCEYGLAISCWPPPRQQGEIKNSLIWESRSDSTQARRALTQDLMQHGSDYTPYEGLEVTGWPIKTLVRGVVVARGFGQFLPRETSRHL